MYIYTVYMKNNKYKLLFHLTLFICDGCISKSYIFLITLTELLSIVVINKKLY